MTDSSDTNEPISSRRSKRSCRLSTKKPTPIIEKNDEESSIDSSDIPQEDPPDLYQLGDILWARVPGNPWWPALLYGCYFVYFFGPTFEYTWANTSALIPYSGLEEFIRQAEASVQQASTKSEQEVLANRYELKVAANKRSQWDKAIEEADAAIKLTRKERVENFSEILKDILNSVEETTKRPRKNSSIKIRQSKKSLSPSTEKTSNRSSAKRQKTKSTTISIPTTQLRVGLPSLTKIEEKRIVNVIMTQSNVEKLTLNQVQTLICQLAVDIVKENYQYEMSCIQIEWFYDFLLNNPEIVFKYSCWFEDDIRKPIIDDPIYLKQSQLKNLIESQMK